MSTHSIRGVDFSKLGGAPQFREETVDDEFPMKQMVEVRKGRVEQFFELLEPQMVAQLVEVP